MGDAVFNRIYSCIWLENIKHYGTRYNCALAGLNQRSNSNNNLILKQTKLPF